MHTMLYAGMLLALGVLLAPAAGFFVQVGLHRRREGASLILGLATLAAAGYSVSVGLGYWHIADGATPLASVHANVGVAFGIMTLALLLHFGLRYAGVAGERNIMRLAYGLTVAFLALLASGHWWSELPERFPELEVIGFKLPLIKLGVTPAATTFHLLVPVGTAAVTLLIARVHSRERQEGMAAVVGSLILAGCAINDSLALGAGWRDTISLLPVGYVAFVAGVAVTLLGRYGRLSWQLERHTEELHRRSGELSHAMAELERTQAEIVKREQLALVGELVAVIAREVRSPIAAASAALEDLAAQEQTADAENGPLGTIETELTHLERTVRDLLDYARPLVPQRAPLDVVALLHQCVEAVCAETGSRDRCVIEPTGKAPELAADAELLAAAFANLVRNAIEAMGSTGMLTITVVETRARDVACVAVELNDTGEGMSAQQRAKALTPFFTTRTGGTGLGLPIAARLVEAHGGTLSVHSEPGRGTTVRVLLPVDAADDRPSSVGHHARATE